MACQLAVVSRPGGAGGIGVRWESRRAAPAAAEAGGASRGDEVFLGWRGRYAAPPAAGCCEACQRSGLSGRDAHGHVEDRPRQPCCSRSNRLVNSSFVLTSPSCVATPSSGGRRRSAARQWVLVRARKCVAGGQSRGGTYGGAERDVEEAGVIGFAAGTDYIRQQTKSWRADVAAGAFSGTDGRRRRGGLEGGTYGGRRRRSLEGLPGRRQFVILRSAEDNNEEVLGPLSVEGGDGISLAESEGIKSLTSSSSSSSSSSGSLFQATAAVPRTAAGDNDANGSSSSSSSSSRSSSSPSSSSNSSGSQGPIAPDSLKGEVEEDAASASRQNGVVGRVKNGSASPSAGGMAEAEDEDRDSSGDEKDEVIKPVQVMRELFRAAVEELELLRAHSGALESEAQAVAERAVSLREEAEKMGVEAKAAIAAAEEAAAGEVESEKLLQQVHAQYVAAVEKVRVAEADLAQAIREARAWEEEVREKEGEEVGDDDEAVAAKATPSAVGDKGDLLTTDKGKEGEEEEEEEEEEQSETALEEDGTRKGAGEGEERKGVVVAASVGGENEAEVSERAEDLGRQEKGDGEAGDDAGEDGKKSAQAMMGKEEDEEEEEEEEEEKEEEEEEEVLKVSSDYAVMVERLRVEALAIEKEMIEARESSQRAAVKAQMLREEAESAGERARATWAEAMSAEELVAEAMLRAEMAVAEEVEACHRVSDAEIALQKAEKLAAQVESAAATLAAAEAAEKKALQLAQAQVGGGGGGLTKDAPEEGALAMVDVWLADDEDASEVVILERDEDKREEEGRDEGREDPSDGEEGDGMTVISEVVNARDVRGKKTAMVEADEMQGASNEGKKVVGSASVDECRSLAAPAAAPSAPGGETKKLERIGGLATEVSANGRLGEVVDDIVDGLAAKIDSSPSSLILGSGTGGVREEKEVRKKDRDKEKASSMALLLSPPSPLQTPTKRDKEGGGVLGAGTVLSAKDAPPALLLPPSPSSSPSSSAAAAAAAVAAAAVSPPLSPSVPIAASGTATTLVPGPSPKQISVAATKSVSEGDAASAVGLGEKLRAFVKEHTVKILLAAALLAAGQVARMEIRQRIRSRCQIGTSAIAPLRRVLPIGRSAGHSIQQYARKLTAQVNAIVDRISKEEHTEEETTLYDTLWLLLVSVIAVPLFQKLPGGSPVLGYLAGGALIGPHALSIIKNVNETKELAEFGVVFLLFTIGLELSLERLRSMKKFVFGLGTAQVFVTTCFVSLFARFIVGMPGPASMVLGSGLALSSTAVVIQVLQERGESTSLYGRATFSVLLLQDLAVVVLLILIPLLSQNTSGGAGLGMAAIGKALGVAAIKGAMAISAIIAGGRLFLRPIYRRMADNKNSEIFAATTLLVVLGTSVLTARAGLSMALGAFLAGLLLAETEYAPQVESDINPYRGLLLGLFFMTVGMSIDPRLLIAQFPQILAAISLLILGKTALLLGLGRIFGLSPLAAARAGLVLAPGGEFAFVAFGEAVTHGIIPKPVASMLFLVVGLSMAVTPWLAAAGQWLASRFEQQDVRSLQPAEAETDDLQDHIIIAGFGRAGQMVAQLLSERLIPFVALDVRSERVSAGRAMDLPVYFGDAGSREVLHKVGAARAAAAVITLDTPGANYRTVWALTKHFPSVKTFVRAHDIDHAVNLEKAGATAVVPETLEPSLQLAAAVLAQMKLPAAEIASSIDEFRASHLAELTEVAEAKGTCLGYGFSRIMTKKTSSQQAGDNDAAGTASIKSSASDGGTASAAADRKAGSADKYVELVP